MECPECGKNFYGMQMMIQNVSVIFAASLICDFFPSDRSFAYSFLQIPSHDGHPCCSAIHFPLSGRVRDFHPLERAHGAQTKNRYRSVLGCGICFFYYILFSACYPSIPLKYSLARRWWGSSSRVSLKYSFAFSRFPSPRFPSPIR